MHAARRVHATAAPDDSGLNAGHFSQAAEVNGTVWIGGTLAIDQAAQRVVDDSPAAAIRQAFTNLAAICAEARVSLDDIVMLTAMLTDLDDLATLNEVQEELFGDPYPPRSPYQVAGLPHGRIELTAVAVRS